MVCDYESAWVALGEFVASKTQHGRDGLLSEMARLAADHRVPAGELSRLLRLHGVEVERTRSMSAESSRDEASASAADRARGAHSSADIGLSGHHRPGGHDGGDGDAGRSGVGCGAGAAAGG